MNNLIAISAPSGAGKSTLCRGLQVKYTEILFSISSTTRPQRDNEKNGYDYDFISDIEFSEKIQTNKFIEFEEVHGYYYGTPKANIDDAITNNRYLLLEVDVNGALKIKKAYPEQTVTVFITLPDVNDLLKRLRKRGTESEERINKRMERIEMELDLKNDFDYCIINDDFDRALNKLVKIIGIET
ncbi:MAG: guanylate kinase [Candidatus Neomarinimicrobiota bacterium]